MRADHFLTKDIFSLSYHWLPRFATVTSYTFRLVKYSDSSIGSFQDRSDHSFGEQLQFSLTSRTNLTATYRFQIVDYDTAPNDSVTNFVLAGVDHHLTEHVTLNLLGGESFRNPQVGESSMTPYVAGTVHYASSNHSLTWITSYGVEEPNVQNATSRTTFRTGLKLNYDLTSHIGATAGVFYHHDQNEGSSTGTTSVGSQILSIFLWPSLYDQQAFFCPPRLSAYGAELIRIKFGLFTQSLFRRIHLYLLTVYRRDRR